MNESVVLFDGILESAREEAKAVEAENKREMEKLRESYEAKSLRAQGQEKQFLDQRKAENSRLLDAQKTQISRDSEVAVMKELRSAAESSVFDHMAKITESEEYKNALVFWIAEGVISLDKDECVVSRGKSDPVTEQTLEKASDVVEKLISKRVKLSLSDQFLSSQGIVVSSTDNRIAYTNLVKTRLSRARSDFENLLEGALCSRK